MTTSLNLSIKYFQSVAMPLLHFPGLDDNDYQESSSTHVRIVRGDLWLRKTFMCVDIKSCFLIVKRKDFCYFNFSNDFFFQLPDLFLSALLLEE